MLNQAFYQRCYLQTGWLPMRPLTRQIDLGDLCQIQQGYLQPLLTLTDLHLKVDVKHSPPLALNPLEWCLNQGAQQIYSGTKQEQNDEGHIDYWSNQVVLFKNPGSFIFHGHEPRCRLITNWSALKEDITLQVTQGHYGFREVYCVTAVAEVERWGLAIASGKRARLEMAAATCETDSFILLSHESAKTEQCHHMATYERSAEQTAYFFKAKKLIFSDATYDHYLNQLLDNQETLGRHALANWLNGDLQNLVKSDELNLTTAMNFFDWADLSLDDVERLLV